MTDLSLHLHPDVIDALRDNEWSDSEIEQWLTDHNATVRRKALAEEAPDAECIAVLNAVSVPLGESPAKGEWSQTSIQRCREALMNARAEIE